MLTAARGSAGRSKLLAFRVGIEVQAMPVIVIIGEIPAKSIQEEKAVLI
jgi:hypothetical protein